MRETGASLLALHLGPPDAALADTVQAAGLPLRLLNLGHDVEDPAGHLARLAEAAEGSALLIRPDSHLSATLVPAPAPTSYNFV